jgi:CheY-like chemotaxis protein
VEALNDGGGAEPLVMLATGVQELPEFFCQEYPYRPDLRPGDYVFLEVSDSGRGIAPEIMGSLFEPRVSTRGEGHGWGLANVLQLVQGMNGAVDVHTTEGAGSTFLIYLPALSEPGAERDRRTPSPDLTVAGALGDGHGYESVVLYIDDDLRLHRSVARLLRQNDFHVEVASGGREGLRRCEALGPRLAAVVLDLTMPDMNGLEVLRRLREQQPWLPVLLVSGYSERMDELPLDERTRFLEKPLMTESLASTLHDMVSLGRGTLSY